MHRLALEEDLPVVDLVHPGDAPGEHRLAGTVVPAQSGHLTRRQIQVHLVQRLHRPKVLVNAPQLQQRLGRGRPLATHPYPGVVIHLSRLRSNESSMAVT